LLVATVKPGTHAFNFMLVHILTTSHAVRVLLPFIPEKYHIPLVRQWWLLALGIFIVKRRPLPDPDNVDSDTKQRGWNYVEDKAVNSDWATDAHYVKGKAISPVATSPSTNPVKAIRVLKEASKTWGDVHDRYLLAALTFVDNFKGWTY
jgi:hypothetical protein